nr:retention module-containing protein [uncultured Halomonas sp.]
MATPIATVLSVIGQAWARDADGNLRALKPGDVLLENEEVLTSDSGSVRLEFADANVMTIGPDDRVFLLADMDAEQAQDAVELNDNIEALLTAIEQGDDDLLNILPSPTAGPGAGSGGGGSHSFVRLERINENVEPLSFDATDAQDNARVLPRGGAGNAFGDQTITDDNEILPDDTQPDSGNAGDSDDGGDAGAGDNVTDGGNDGSNTGGDDGSSGDVGGSGDGNGSGGNVDGSGGGNVDGPDSGNGSTGGDSGDDDTDGGNDGSTDGDDSSGGGTVSNRAPNAVSDTASGPEDTQLTGNVLDNDSDPDGNSLSLIGFSIDGVDYAAGDTAELRGVGSLVIASDGSYTFTPVENWNGQVPAVSYTITDGRRTAAAELNLTVTAVNDAPVAQKDSATVDEDASISGNVLDNDSDVDGDSLTVSEFTVNGNTYQAGETAELEGIGSLVIVSNGSYIFTPVENWNGQVPTISYTVTDGELTDTAELQLAVTAVNDAPIAQDDTATGDEDAVITGNVLANDSDVDADSNFSVSGFSIGENTYQPGDTAELEGIGSLIVQSDGSYTFTPVENWNGQVPTVSYTVTDGELTDTAELQLSVTAVNDAPVAESDSATGDEDAVLTGNVLDNDSDVDSDALTVSNFSIAGVEYAAGETAELEGIGSLVIQTDGSYTFTPVGNWNGQVPTISYTITDGELTDTAELQLTVTAINDAPAAQDDSVTGDEDAPLNGNVLANDSDVDGDSLTVTDFTIDDTTYQAGDTAELEGIGTLVVASDGSYTFTPVENWNGQVPVVSYTVTDGELTDTAELQLTITAVNDVPVAQDDSAIGDEDVPLVGNVLANDSDVDSDSLEVSEFTIGDDTYQAGQTAELESIGSLVIESDGSYTFTPVENWNGQVPAISYTITDGELTDTAELQLTVSAVNDAPTARDDTVTGGEDTVITGNVLDNDSDVDGDSLTVSEFTANGNTYQTGQTAELEGIGSLVIESDGSYTFTPVDNWNGQVPTVSYTVTDGELTDTAELNLTVSAVNDVPVAESDSATSDEDTPLIGNVLTNDRDVDGDVLTVSDFTVGGIAFQAGDTAEFEGIGSLVIESDGSYIFTLVENWNGQVPTVSYTITDGELTDTAELSLTVTAANDAPVAQDDTATDDEDITLTGNVLNNDSDVDGDSLTVNEFTVNGNTYQTGQTAELEGIGSLVIESDGSYTFTPVENWNGQVPPVSYTITDGRLTDTAELNLTVTPVNDSPVAQDDGAVGDEDAPLAGNVLTNDSDVDGDSLTVTEFTIGDDTYQAGQTAELENIGSLVIQTDGSYTFTPVENWNGQVPVVSYTVTDGELTDTATLELVINAVNDAPVAEGDSVTGDEDAPLSGNVLTNDSDVDGDSLTVKDFTVDNTTYQAGETAELEGIGSLIIASDGRYTFTPVDNWNGQVPTVSYTVTDSELTDTAELQLTVAAVNDSPVAEGDSATSDEDTVITGNVLTNDSDVDDDSLTVSDFTIVDTTYQAGETAELEGIGTLVVASDGSYTFTPVENWNGQVPTVSYTVTDGELTDTAELNLTVSAVNDAPVAESDSATSDEDTLLIGNVLTNDRDVDGDALTVSDFTVGGIAFQAGDTAEFEGIGSLVIESDGSYTFMPVENWNGQVPIVSYTVTDGELTDTAELNLEVTAVNDAPVAQDDSAIGDEDAPLVGNVLANDSDVDNDPLTVSGFSINSVEYAAGEIAELEGIGSLTIQTDGSYTFTPVENWNGQVPTISYIVTDGELTDTATLELVISAVNDAPVAEGDSVTGDEDAPLSGNVLTNDSDVDGDSLTVTDFTIDDTTYQAGDTAELEGIGSLIIASDGRYTFTPNENWNGQVPTVSYTVTDGELTDTAELSLTVSAVNDAPTARDDTVTGGEDTVITGNVLDNDSDVDGDSLTVSEFIVNGNTYQTGQTAELKGIGSLVIESDGSYTFTPIENWNGQVPTVSYIVTDGELTDTAELNLEVTPVNDAPVAQDDTATGDEDAPLNGNVLANDSDVDGDSFTVTEFTIGNDIYQAGDTAELEGIGSLVIASDGSYTFTPVENWNGQVPVISYTVTDGELADTAELNLEVTAVNDAPVAESDSATGDEDAPLNGNVLGNDSDVDGDSLTVSGFTVGGIDYAVGETAELEGIGSLTIQTNGSYIFTPVENWNGQVPTVSYTVTDGNLTDTAELQLTVTAVNDAPIAQDDTATGDEDTVVSGNVLANDGDIDGDSLTVTEFTVGDVTYQAGETAELENIGSLVIQTDGSYTFTPVENWNGQVPTISYTITDGELTDTAELNLEVTAVNDAPVAQDDIATSDEDAVITGNVLTNDSDVDGDSLTVTDFTIDNTTYQAGETAELEGIGSLIIASDGRYTFTPNENWNGQVPTVSYTVTDGVLIDTAELQLTVTAVNDAPVAQDDAAIGDEDASITGNVLANDSDIEGDVLSVSSFVVEGTIYQAGETAELDGIGSLTLGSGGSYTFTPVENWNGQVPTISYTITDGELTDTAELNLTVTPVNDSPVAEGDSAVGDEDAPLNGNVLTNDSDVDGDSLTVTEFTVGDVTYQAGETAELENIGSLVIQTDGSYTFTPVENWNGQVPVVSYTVTDEELTATAQLQLAVTAVNDAPVVEDDVAIGDEDTVITGNVLDNDSDVDNSLTVNGFTVGGATYQPDEIAELNGIGSLTIQTDGSYIFTPVENWNGQVPAISYTVTDGELTGTATLDVTVVPVNDPPVAEDDSATGDEDTALTGNVLTNDSDIDSATLSVSDFTVGSVLYQAGEIVNIDGVGALRLDSNGNYTFIPNEDWNGKVPPINYTVTDGELTDTATLDLTITPVNDAPNAVDDASQGFEDNPLTGNVLTNDSDIDSATLRVSGFTVGETSYQAGETARLSGIGSLIVRSDGSYSFTPLPNWYGKVPIATYTVTDGELTNSAALKLSITAVNDAPVAQNDTGTGIEDALISGNVLANDSDIEGDVLTVSSFNVAGTRYAAGDIAKLNGVGSLTIGSDGNYTFTPNEGWNGQVPLISYTVTDGKLKDTATLKLDVTPVNDAPIAVDDDNSVAFGGVLAVSESEGILTNDSDPDGNALRVTRIDGIDIAESGSTNVVGRYGILDVDSQGGYTYASNLEAPVLYGFETGDEYLGRSDLNLLENFLLDDDAQLRVSSTENGVGVIGSNERSAPNQINDNGEVLIADLGSPVGSASFGVSELFNNEQGGETGKWYAYDAGGQLVASGAIDASTVSYDSDSNDAGRVRIENVAADFQYLAFESLPYTNMDSSNDGGDYFVTDIRVEDTFDYAITDDQGGSASATLSLDSTASLINYQPPADSIEPPEASIFITTPLFGDDNLLSNSEARQPITIKGGVGGDAQAGDDVIVRIGGIDYATKVTDALTWSIEIPASDLARLEPGQVEASVAGQDGWGNAFSVLTGADYQVAEPGTLSVGNNANNNVRLGSGDDVHIGDKGGKITLIDPAKNYNISLIVDVSGSMQQASGTAGLSRMALTKQALQNLAGQLEAHEGAINVQLVAFSSRGKTEISIQGVDSTNIDRLEKAIDKLSANGGTNYQAAFGQAVSWFNDQNTKGASQQGDFQNLAYFLTDGDPTYYFDSAGRVVGPGNATSFPVLQSSIEAFEALSTISQVNAVGIGANISEKYLQFFDNSSVIGERTLSSGRSSLSAPVGQVDIVNNADDLQAALEGSSQFEELAELGDDVVIGGAGNDILFGDTLDTDQLAWTNGNTGDVFTPGNHDGLGYQGLSEYLRWSVNGGEAPGDEQVSSYVRDNVESLIGGGRAKSGNDRLEGEGGDDILVGGGGNDTLLGGAGSDTLYGGIGADVFVWTLGDQATAGKPARDVVKDFTLDAINGYQIDGEGEGDRLALAELLQDESDDTIDNYIAAKEEGGNTVLFVSSNGQLSDNGAGADQTILLEGVSMANQSSSDFIKSLIDNQQLTIDQ